ncbi:unnamed protein product, partial [marine sediment metagenome]
GPVAPGEQEEGEKMDQWTIDKARDWYLTQPWLVGCNFLPSTAVNQLEMWQADTYDAETIDRELSWAEDLGFNTLRVYLHDLVWSHDPDGFAKRIDHFLGIADHHGMRVILVLFDDCHRPDPEIGVQPLPVPRVHNSGWKHSPGQKLVLQFHDGTVAASEKKRLKEYVQGVLTRFKDDERVLMWDLYNEPGQTGNGDKTNVLLKLTWEWAQDIRPSQPLPSAWGTTPIQRPYWVKIGTSSPRRLSTVALSNTALTPAPLFNCMATIASTIVPGIRRIMKKTMRLTTNTVGIISSSLLIM